MTYGGRVVEGREVEVCDECGFDTRRVADEGAAFSAVYADLAALLGESAEPRRRPDPEIFSAGEYVEHCLEVTDGLLGYIAEALDRPHTVVTDIDSAAGLTTHLASTLGAAERAVQLVGKYPEPVSVGWMLTHLLHDLTHHVLDIRRGYARMALRDLPGPWTSGRDRPL